MEFPDRNWVFFDIGNVIFYDLPLLACIWRHFYLTLKEAGWQASFGQVLEFREQILLSRPPEDNPRCLIAQRYVSHISESIRRKAVDDWHHLYPGANHPLPGIAKVIEQLRGNYRLGIIANQPDLALDELEKHDLKHLFDRIVISDVVGYHKPDVRIFEEALKRAGADPKNSIMVGDRIDNDIRPAKSLGMKTVWLDQDFRAMSYQPKDNYERLYIQSYLKITGIDQGIKGPQDRPDEIIQTIDQLPEALSRISAGKNTLAEAMT
ncbi:HAD family hydrolase [candidate division TA06 bacterium]|uniref:HAD family hydrolase n=1 Tax=candidate division TA06 bacterium TaxID=2250710 RepID=A0A933IAH8_UNCT6|nr:HAD family hydrolase [candidate division TA06 bacterium]